METEKPDDDLTSKDRNEVSTKWRNWASIIILWGGILYCLIAGVISDIRVLAAIIFLSATTIINYFNLSLGAKVTLGLIIIGIFNLVDFFPVKVTMGFEIMGVEIGLEFILFGIGIIHYFTNRGELSKFIREVLKRDLSDEQIRSVYRVKVNRFKRNFSNKEIPELEGISNNKKLLPEAIQAALELIDEKNTD